MKLTKEQLLKKIRAAVDQDWVNNFIHGVDGTGNYGGRNLEEGFQYGQYVRKELLTETRDVVNHA